LVSCRKVEKLTLAQAVLVGVAEAEAGDGVMEAAMLCALMRKVASGEWRVVDNGLVVLVRHARVCLEDCVGCRRVC
jgi:hypothetical protein